MPIDVRNGKIRRFLIDYEYGHDCVEVIIFETENGDSWVEMYIGEYDDDGNLLAKRPFLTYYLSDAIELLEKILGYLRKEG